MTKPREAKTPLLERYGTNFQTLEAGCDEAGRGCLAGPVFAAAVILPESIPDFLSQNLNDSKKITKLQRERLRIAIENAALSFGVAMVEPNEIDKINILNASILAMHRALNKLTVIPEFIIVDGNKFLPYANIKHKCLVGGDARYLSIAAASVLAKTYRDDYLMNLHIDFPAYGWASNKGYPTPKHLEALAKHGPCIQHRKSFAPIRQGRFLWEGNNAEF